MAMTDVQRCNAYDKAIGLLMNPDKKDSFVYNKPVYCNPRLETLACQGKVDAVSANVFKGSHDRWLITIHLRGQKPVTYKMNEAEAIPIKIFKKEIIEAMNLLEKVYEGCSVKATMMMVKEPRKTNYRVSRLRVNALSMPTY